MGMTSEFSIKVTSAIFDDVNNLWKKEKEKKTVSSDAFCISKHTTANLLVDGRQRS